MATTRATFRFEDRDRCVELGAGRTHPVERRRANPSVIDRPQPRAGDIGGAVSKRAEAQRDGARHPALRCRIVHHSGATSLGMGRHCICKRRTDDHHGIDDTGAFRCAQDGLQKRVVAKRQQRFGNTAEPRALPGRYNYSDVGHSLVSSRRSCHCPGVSLPVR